MLVGALACVVWYFELVPLLLFEPPTKQAQVSQTVQSQNGILVAQILDSPERKNAKGKIFLFIPNEDQTALPVYQERFTLDERGLASILLVVPAREYSLIAFIDSNDNGQLDFDNDRATEEFRMPKSVTISGSSTAPAPGGLVALPAQIPCLCYFDFTTTNPQP